MQKVLIIVGAVILSLFSEALAETIHLRSGRTIEGRVVYQDQKEVVVDIAVGRITLARDQIERIEESPSSGLSAEEELLKKAEMAEAEGNYSSAIVFLNLLVKQYPATTFRPVVDKLLDGCHRRILDDRRAVELVFRFVPSLRKFPPVSEPAKRVPYETIQEPDSDRTKDIELLDARVTQLTRVKKVSSREISEIVQSLLEFMEIKRQVLAENADLYYGMPLAQRYEKKDLFYRMRMEEYIDPHKVDRYNGTVIRARELCQRYNNYASSLFDVSLRLKNLARKFSQKEAEDTVAQEVLVEEHVAEGPVVEEIVEPVGPQFSQRKELLDEESGRIHDDLHRVELILLGLYVCLGLLVGYAVIRLYSGARRSARDARRTRERYNLEEWLAEYERMKTSSLYGEFAKKETQRLLELIETSADRQEILIAVQQLSYVGTHDALYVLDRFWRHTDDSVVRDSVRATIEQITMRQSGQ